MNRKRTIRFMFSVLLILGLGMLTTLSFSEPNAPVYVSPQWGVDLGQSPSYPVIGDLNNDGYKEIIVVSNDGSNDVLHAMDYNGNTYYTYSFSSEEKVSNPVVGDVDGDGNLETVVSSVSNGKLKLYCIKYDGTDYFTPLVIDDKFYGYTTDPILNGDRIIIGATHVIEAAGGWNGFIDLPTFYVLGFDIIEADKNGQIINKYESPEELLAGDVGSSQIISPLAIGSASQNFKVKVPGEGLQGFWKFDDQDLGIDSGPNGNTLTNINGVESVSGNFGNAAKFTAANKSYLMIPPEQQNGLHNTGNITVSAWIKVNGFPKGVFIIAARQTDNDALVDYTFIIDNDGSNRLASWNGSSLVYSNGSISLDSWHHVAFVRSGNQITFYLDGKENGSSSQEFPNTVEDAPFFVGSNSGATVYANGEIDELAVFDMALTPEEIGYLYDNKLYVENEYPMISPMVFFTLGSSKLYTIALADINENGLPDPEDKYGVVTGYPIDSYSPGLMGAPTVLDNKVIVGDVDEAVHPIVRVFSNNPDGTIDYDMFKSDFKPDPISVMKMGNISLMDNIVILSYFNLDWDNLYRTEAVMFNLEDPSENAGAEWSYKWPYIEVIPVEINTKVYYLLGNVAKTNYGEDTLKFSIGSGVAVGSAVSDLEGDGFLETVVTTNAGYLYNFKYGLAIPKSRNPLWPMYRWVQGPENNPPEIIEVDAPNEVEVGQEVEIGIKGKDGDVNDNLGYSWYGDGVIISEYYSDLATTMWKAKWIPTEDDVGIKTITLKVADPFSEVSQNINISVKPASPDLTVENADIYEIKKEEKKKIYKRVYNETTKKWELIEIGEKTVVTTDHYEIEAYIKNIGKGATLSDENIFTECYLVKTLSNGSIYTWRSYEKEEAGVLLPGGGKQVLFTISKGEYKISTFFKVHVLPSDEEDNKNNNVLSVPKMIKGIKTIF